MMNSTKYFKIIDIYGKYKQTHCAIRRFEASHGHNHLYVTNITG